MRFLWFGRREQKEMEKERAELNEARRKADELDKRATKLLRDNHFVQDIKKALGAQ